MERAKKFRHGLREEIRTLVAANGGKTYDKMSKVAQDVEASSPARNKREHPGSNSNYQNNSKRPNNNNNRPAYSQQPQQQQQQQAKTPNKTPQHQQQKAPICNYCKRPGHNADICRKRLGHCLSCGSATHEVKDCPTAYTRTGATQQRAPLPTQQQNFDQHQQETGRAFALAVEEPEPEPTGDVITGSILLHSHPALALFDSVATHSFISSNFIAAHHLVNGFSKRICRVMTGGGPIPITETCTCPITISGHKFLTQFLIMPIPNYDVVIGMDWLSERSPLEEKKSVRPCFKMKGLEAVCWSPKTRASPLEAPVA